MSNDNPIIIDLAKLKVMFYAQIDILVNLKGLIAENNKVIEANNQVIKQMSMNVENVIKAIQNIENASTIPDDGKTEFYE